MGGMLFKSAVGVGAVVAALVALRMVLGLLGVVVGLVSFLLFTVIPLAIIGWLVVKLVRWIKRKPAFE